LKEALEKPAFRLVFPANLRLLFQKLKFWKSLDYLEICKQADIPPQRPYSGKVMLRISPEIHAEIAMKAEAHGKSLNQWATEALVLAE